MKRWVVTGPTGAGKSELTRLLANRGAAVLDGDRLGHEVLRTSAVSQRIEQVFGSSFLSNGEVDRTKLGRLVFGDEAALVRLNEITHGPLSELASRQLDELAAANLHELAVLEAAVYFLLPCPPRADLTITVTAPVEIREDRLARGGLTLVEARARIARQATMAAAFASADVTISNTGTLAELERRVDQLLAEQFPQSG